MVAKPCPPIDDHGGSTTVTAIAVATAASKALPPSIRIRIPGVDASGWSDVTMARRPEMRGRSTNCPPAGWHRVRIARKVAAPARDLCRGMADRSVGVLADERVTG